MNDLERNELLVRIDERVKTLTDDVGEIKNSLPPLTERVDSLESSRDKARGQRSLIAVVGGGGGLIGMVTAVWHLLHK